MYIYKNAKSKIVYIHVYNNHSKYTCIQMYTNIYICIQIYIALKKP